MKLKPLWIGGIAALVVFACIVLATVTLTGEQITPAERDAAVAWCIDQATAEGEAFPSVSCREADAGELIAEYRAR